MDIDERNLEYLLANNPKVARFYSLFKMWLNSVPGRSVVSKCGLYMENRKQHKVTKAGK